jgi:hypothetical protein
VSTCLLITTIATHFLPSPNANTLQVYGKPMILFPIVYGSWIHRISVPSPPIIFSRLSVANLECWRLICMLFFHVFRSSSLLSIGDLPARHLVFSI